MQYLLKRSKVVREAVSVITDNIKNSDSWVKYGGYSWGKTPKKYDSIIMII